MDPELLREVDEARDLAKRSTYIEWQVYKAFQLDKMRNDLDDLFGDLLDRILVLENLPPEVRLIPSVQKMIAEARERVEKIKELIKKTE
jgi:hypothetical protein